MYGIIARAPLTGGENLSFLDKKPVTPASSAFPKGITTFPIRTVEIIRLRRPIMAPGRGPIDTAASREGKADKWNSTVVPDADGNLIAKRPKMFPMALKNNN
ncbi:MAG: hypothetical protein QXS79_00705 [Candidatus Bathyarchaeia archaeon]